jgi:adhesin transport system outer membrane protein
MFPSRYIACACLASVAVWSVAVASDARFTIFDAINQAVATNPGVGEAAANRRATEAEMRQTQGTLLPQVRLEAKAGRHRFNHRDEVPPPLGNGRTLNANEASVVVRQLVFDGLTSINEIWRQAARVDAAAYRVRERSELIALDAAEAYIDVVRFTHLIGLANQNITVHRRILANVDARFQGGRAGEGDLEQVRERVEAAIAIRAQFLQQLDEARAAFRRVVGIEPHNLRVPGRLRGLPGSKDGALAVTLRHNPTIQAGQSDRDAARHAFNATAGTFLPTIALEGRATRAYNTGTVLGTREEASGFVVATWDVFTGFKNEWRRAETAERYQESTMRHARLQREAFELIDRAWAARTITNERMAALLRQIQADRRVIEAYQKEYDLGQRSLIDLLNAQNQLFNAQVSLESTRGTAIFADYQLLAAMGQLLPFLKTPQPVDSEPLVAHPLGILPMQLPPILLSLPEPGPEPLNIGVPRETGLFAGSFFGSNPRSFPAYAMASAEATVAPAAAAPSAPIVVAERATDPDVSIQSRWPQAVASWFDGLLAANHSEPAEPSGPQAARRAEPTSESSATPNSAAAAAVAANRAPPANRGATQKANPAKKSAPAAGESPPPASGPGRPLDLGAHAYAPGPAEGIQVTSNTVN